MATGKCERAEHGWRATQRWLDRIGLMKELVGDDGLEPPTSSV
jgi:hypothetical protein